MRLAPVAGSVAINAALFALLANLSHHDPHVTEPPRTEITVVDVVPPDPPRAEVGDGGGVGGGGAPAQPVKPAVRSHGSTAVRSPWADVAIGREERTSDNGGGEGGGEGGDGGGIGGGIGGGHGRGHGRGIGLGDGGAVDRIANVPAPPAPQVSRARAAKLLHPTRETEVDEAELFVARVTVDVEGDVVGAHMLRTHPGSRGDTASSMIWQFRYAPALDFDGNPVRSTFEQTFAVR